MLSDYDYLVELAAKALAERDNHPMPEWVTTPEAFYVVMAREALDAIGLLAILAQLPPLEQEKNGGEQTSPLATYMPAGTRASQDTPERPPQTVSVAPGPDVDCNMGATGISGRHEWEDRKMETARLRREWRALAEERLAVVADSVARLRNVFGLAREQPSEAAEVVASEVVLTCDNLAAWLSTMPAPRGLGNAEAELGAAAGVYRNAAVLLRNLKDIDGYRRWLRSNACATMLEQGDCHAEACLVALAKKRGSDDDFRKRSSRKSASVGATSM